MASTYALPTAPAAHAHSHNHGHGLGHSRSHARTRSQQYTPEHSSYSSSPLTSASPGQSDMNGSGLLHGAVRSPYAEYADLSHDRAPAGRLRGESDLSRTMSSPRRAVSSTKYGFSPIHEAAPAPPPIATGSQSWIELPEALTAILIPLPYLLASLAFPIAVGRRSKLPSTLSEAVAESAPVVEPLYPEGRAPLLHALILSSATLLLVGVIAKISASLQPLDRRKAAKGTFVLSNAPIRIVSSVFGILLPFYAAVQLGGSRTALGLLVAIAAGLCAPGQQADHTRRGAFSQALRTRKATCGAMLLGSIIDIVSSGNALRSVLGHGALITSVMLVPPPLPTTIRGRAIDHDEDSYINQGSARATLPRSASPLVNSFESTLLTLVSGLLLAVVSILYYLATSSFSSVSLQTFGLSLLSITSATALIFRSLPAALQTQRYTGLKLGALCIAGFSLWEHSHSGLGSVIFLWICAALVGTTVLDTQSTPASVHSHAHSHMKHTHAHQYGHGHSHDHHLHGNHSKFSAFLIARATPGSIIHSVLIERDSRRIAYFGVLNLAFMLVQFFYGFVSGSLGLLTDSIHMLFDCAGLAVGLAAAVMSKWRPNARFPYGYGKIDTLSGFANGVFLLLVSVEIIFDAFERLCEGHELHRLNELLIVSILGFLVNIVGLTAFGHAHHGHGHDHGDHDHGHSHDNENMQGIFLHILADALGSVAVIISTLLTKYYGWSGWDPIASCIIAILIFLSAIPLVKSSGARLMLSLPNDLEYGIRNALGELGGLRGVVGYTVPKFWLEDAGAAHAEVHAKEEDCGLEHTHKHSHDGHVNDHAHSHSHDHSHDPGHGHGHSHSHAHDHHTHSHSHDHIHDHNHDHSHSHDHGAHKQRVLGVIHVIACRAADIEDVRERTVQFLRSRGMDIVVHVEREGEGRCWCGGGIKTN